MEYTKEQIRNMKAGAELDALVMTLVMGYKWYCYQTGPRPGDMVRCIVAPEHQAVLDRDDDFSIWTREEYGDLPISHNGAHASPWVSASTNMGAAWVVWQICAAKHGEDGWSCALLPALRIRDCDYSTHGTVALVVRELNQLHICQAALLAALKLA